MYAIIKVKNCNLNVKSITGYTATIESAKKMCDYLNNCLNKRKKNKYGIIYTKIYQLD